MAKVQSLHSKADAIAYCIFYSGLYSMRLYMFQLRFCTTACFFKCLSFSGYFWMPNLWLDGFPVLLYRVCSHLPQGPRLQAEENLTNSLLRLLGKVQVQSNCRGTPGNLCGNIYSGDLNNEHLNNQLLLVRYSGVQYSNGSLVFRQPFGYYWLNYWHNLW